jgi:hypothetical protein
MKGLNPAPFRRRAAIPIRGLLALWICGCVLSTAWGRQPERISQPATRDDLKSATNAIVQDQSAKISLLGNKLDSVSSQLTNQLNGLKNDLDGQAARLHEAAAASSQAGVNLSNWVQDVTNQFAANMASVNELRRDVELDKNSISNLSNSVAYSADHTGDIGGKLAGITNSMAAMLDKLRKDLGDKLEKEESAIRTMPNTGGGVPASFRVLLLANLAVGIAGLAVLALLARRRKSEGERLQSAVLGQIPGMMKELGERVQPKLDEAVRQCGDVARILGQATEKNQEILESMSKKHEQFLGRLAESSEKASQAAIQAWEKQSRAILGQLQEQAAQDFNRLFDGVRTSWQSELGQEFQKFKSEWDSTVQENQKVWRERLDAEIDAIKQLWLKALEDHQKRWQSRLDDFMDEQPTLWQQRLESTAQKANASWTAQIEQFSAKTESAKHTIEEVFADASTRLTQLNRQLGKEFEQLKGRDESLSALVWPAFFRDGGALAGWRKRIEDRLVKQDPCAFELFLALGRFSNAVRDSGDPRRVGEALNAVGMDAYPFWKSIGTPALDAALEWRTGFKGFLDASGIPIDIILALERDRFDPNTMLSVDTGSATRMFVKEALSWIVLDKSGESPIVRHHARVITC